MGSVCIFVNISRRSLVSVPVDTFIIRRLYINVPSMPMVYTAAITASWPIRPVKSGFSLPIHGIMYTFIIGTSINVPAMFAATLASKPISTSTSCPRYGLKYFSMRLNVPFAFLGFAKLCFLGPGIIPPPPSAGNSIPRGIFRCAASAPHAYQRRLSCLRS